MNGSARSSALVDPATAALLATVHDRLAAHDAREANGYRFEPLTITAELMGAVVTTRAAELSLDGLLAYALLERLLGADLWALPPLDPSAAGYFLRLPLALAGPDAQPARGWGSGYVPDVETELREHWWWWACSAPATLLPDGMPSPVRQTDYWRKRFATDPADARHLTFGGRTEKIQIGGGFFKAYNQPMQTLLCAGLRWHVVGDAVAITDLLAGVTAIGKRRRTGYGAVRRWRVERAEMDASLWTADGTVARPIPVLALAGLGIGSLTETDWREPPHLEYIAYRAPGWQPHNQALCVTGGVRR